MSIRDEVRGTVGTQSELIKDFVVYQESTRESLKTGLDYICDLNIAPASCVGSTFGGTKTRAGRTLQKT